VSRPTLAPTLRFWTERCTTAPGRALCDKSEHDAARAELRALLAVARAADRHTNPHEKCPACDPAIRVAVERLRRLSETRSKTRRRTP
jgi:hypothetical protein